MLKLINTNECCNVYFIFAAKTCIHCTHAHSSETVRELKRWWNVKREATSTASTYIHSFMLLAEMHVHRVHCTACLWFLDVLIVRVLYGNVANLLAEEHTHTHKLTSYGRVRKDLLPVETRTIWFDEHYLLKMNKLLHIISWTRCTRFRNVDAEFYAANTWSNYTIHM